jgi:hypothetical protein
MQTETENISCEGFYFLCGNPYAPGDQLEATIQVPWRDVMRDDRHFLALQCRVEVVRIERPVPDQYGVGCRIRSYVVVPTRVPGRFSQPARMATNDGDSPGNSV